MRALEWRRPPFDYRFRKRNVPFPANGTGVPFSFQWDGTERKRCRFFDRYCICRMSVSHSVYTNLLFQRYTIFLPLRACAYDVGDTGVNSSMWRKRASSVTSSIDNRGTKKRRNTEKTQKQISEISKGELQRLRLRGARLQTRKNYVVLHTSQVTLISLVRPARQVSKPAFVEIPYLVAILIIYMGLI